MRTKKIKAMKTLKVIVTVFLAAIAISSCTKEPSASFTVSSKLVSTNENVKFTNTSTDADHYQWEFGDGLTSSDANPTHAYSKEGTFTVKLTAFSANNKKSSTYTETITVADTKATITVKDIDTYETIDGITATLYKSFEDWDNETNPVAQAVTNSDGVVTFTGLEATTYYVDLYDGYYSNSFGYDDESKIKIGPLQAHQNNEYTLYVEASSKKNK
jgi:PKD repeat protein